MERKIPPCPGKIQIPKVSNLYRLLQHANTFLVDIKTSLYIRCNVRTLWDLWYFGQEASNVAPYRQLHAWDLDTKADRAMLSKAVKVMEKLSSIAVERSPTIILRDLSINDSRQIFAISFNTLCMTLTGGALAQDIDRRHFGDSSYVTFYDMILKHKKRTHAQANDVYENVLLVDV